MEIRQDIQFLRGLAVLIVVLFHLQIPLFQNGFLGVDVFFVISGFLMAKLYDKGTIFDFYKRRLDRLFPAYAATLLLTFFFGAFLTVPVDFNQLFEQGIAASFFVSNIFFWSQSSYFDKAAFNPLLNLWSLAVEIQFYLIVPFLYPFLRRNKWHFLLIFMASLFSCLAVQMISPKTSFFHVPFRIWEFLIGAYVAWWSNEDKASLLNRRKYSLLFLSALVLSLFVFNLKPDAVGTILYGHPALPALIVTLLTGMVIKYGIDVSILKSFTGQFFVKIGDYSYSIYLVHFPVIVLVNYFPFGGTRLKAESFFELVLALFLIILASAILYFFVEKKFSAKINAAKVRFFVFIGILGSAFGLHFFNLNQYSLVERNIFSAWTDRDTYRCGKIFRILNPLDLVCNLNGSVNDKGVLLIGNSHADSIKKVFSDRALDYGITTFFVVPNDPLLNASSRAERFIDEAVRRNVKALVIHYSNSYDNAIFRNELVKLIDLAKSKRIKIFLIAPVPTYDVDIPKAMFNDLGSMKTFSMTIEKHFERTQTFRDLMAGYTPLDVEVLDPVEFLCGADGACFISTQDFRPYYFDSNHLTLTGSALLKPLFERILSRI